MLSNSMLRIFLLPASLSAAGAAAIAEPQSERARSQVLEGTTIVYSQPVKPLGTISLSEVASHAAAAPRAKQKVRPVEMPKPRRPNDSFTGTFHSSVLQTLQRIPSNAAVVPTAVSIQSVKGFVGIHSIDNATVNSTEFEPPDQGLAVNNNTAVETVNLVLQVFNTATGAAMTAPMSLSDFFEAGSDEITDPQVFFDPAAGRWFLTVADITTGELRLAVSTTSDPTKSYTVYAFPTGVNVPGCPCIPD